MNQNSAVRGLKPIFMYLLSCDCSNEANSLYFMLVYLGHMLLVRLPILSDLIKFFYLDIYVLNSNKLAISKHQNMKVKKREICYLFLNFPLSLTQTKATPFF